MAPLFRSIFDKEQARLEGAQRKVFRRIAGPLADAPPPVDYAADARVLDDFLRGTEPPTPPEPPTPRPFDFYGERQRQAAIGQRNRAALEAFREAARRGAPAARPFTFAEDVAPPVSEAYKVLEETPPLFPAPFGVLPAPPEVVRRAPQILAGIGLAVSPFAGPLKPVGGALSAAGVNLEPGRNLAREVGIRPEDDVATVLGKLRDYQATRPGEEQFITENLALLAIDPVFRNVAAAIRALGPAARAVGRTAAEMGQVAKQAAVAPLTGLAGEAGGVGKRALTRTEVVNLADLRKRLARPGGLNDRDYALLQRLEARQATPPSRPSPAAVPEAGATPPFPAPAAPTLPAEAPGVAAAPREAPAPAPRAAPAPEAAPGGIPPREPTPPTTAGAAPTPPPAGLPPIRPPTVGTTPAGVFRIPAVPAPAATLAELRTLHPERLRVTPEPLQSQRNADAVVEALQVHRYAEEVGRNATAPIMAHLRAIGDDAALFGVDARGFATKVGNPNNLSLQVGDVMERIGRYTTTPEQQEYVRVIRSIYDAMLVEARKHGVTINEIPTLDEWFHYIGRRVVQKVPAPGQRAMPGVSRLGAKAAQQKQRFYDLAEDAVVALEQKGAGYVLPSEALQANLMAFYKLIGDKQALDILKPITRLPTKRRPPVFGEVPLDMPGFRLYWDTGKGIATRLRYTDAPTARAIAKAFTPEQVPAALETARGLARLGVMFKATWDWSWSFIQGQLVLGHDLKNLVGAVARPGVVQPSAVWARSLYGGIRATLNPRHLEEFRVKHWDTYVERIREGGITGETEFFAAAGPLERAAAKVPVAGPLLGKVVKQTFGRFNTAFTTAREEAATLQYEGLRPAWLADGGSLRELSEWSDKATGVVSPQMLGVSRTQAAAESTGAFAPIWIRAQLMVMRDLFRGNRTAAQARENLTALTAGMTAAYVATSMALGQKPKLNPLPPRFGGDGGKFFTWEIGSEHIGPSIYALWMIKFLSEVTAMAVDEPERLLVVDDTNPAVRSAFTKASPLVNLQRELITGRDFLGRELVRAGKEFQDVARVLVEPLMPISLQDMLEEPPTAAGFAAEMLGWRAYPVSALDKLARVKTPGFKGSFYDLEPAQQRAIMGSPEGQRMMAEERLRPDFRKREEQRQELLREQRERNAGLVAGTLNGKPYNWRRWAEDRTRAQIKREGEVETWEVLRPFVERPPKNDNEKALRGLYELAKRFEGKGGRFDSVGYARARESYLDMLSVDDRDYIIRNVGPGRTAIERDVNALEEKAKAYYTIIDEQIGGDKELQRAYEEHNAADAQAKAFMRQRNPELATLVKAISDGRERLRLQNPNVDLFAHLFKGAKLMNRANLDAARAGKLTFAGVPVPYTGPGGPMLERPTIERVVPERVTPERAMPSMFAPTPTPTAGGFPNERTRELFERIFSRP